MPDTSKVSGILFVGVRVLFLRVTHPLNPPPVRGTFVARLTESAVKRSPLPTLQEATLVKDIKDLSVLKDFNDLKGGLPPTLTTLNR